MGLWHCLSYAIEVPAYKIYKSQGYQEYYQYDKDSNSGLYR